MTLGMGLIAFTPSTAPGLFIIDNIIANAGKGFFVGLLFAMMADTVDYGEWKTGVRAAGFLFAAANVGVKLGLGLGGAFSAWTLAAAGYVPNAVACIILLLLYRLDKRHSEIVRDLAARRALA
jgi:GPH family glycoside/pentoside/hexuronide:cation symporter